MTYTRLKKTTSAFAAGLLISAFGMFSGATLDRPITPNIAQAACENDYCGTGINKGRCLDGLPGLGCNMTGTNSCETYECNTS